MPTRVVCPSCGCKMRAPDGAVGRTGRCLRCKAPVAVPPRQGAGPEGPAGDQATTPRPFPPPGASQVTVLSPTRATARPAADEFPLPPDVEHHPRYRVLGLLGAGGMGTVYKARHLLMDRLVALKVVNPGLVGEPEMAERFRREVKAAARLAHPNVVTAYDAERAGDTHFLVMEYVEGTNLARLVAERGPLPVGQACDYARQAALGLQHAHEQGMVHRDVKPHNLMLAPGGVVKILDFGLARFASEAAPPGGAAAAPPAGGRAAPGGLTSGYRGLGTADYLAPEEARDARTADIRADVYSLGCTLYHLLSGRVPFPEGTALDKLLCHAGRAPAPVRALRPEVPAGLAGVLALMMAKGPAGRPQSPAEAAAALAPFAGPPRPHVLVVDDAPDIRLAMRRALQAKGYAVCCAADGREALERLHSPPLPGLILLDLLMPGMGGLQFLEERARDPRLASVPVLVISAASAGEAAAVALGAADFLQKPVGPGELVAKVRAHTAEAGPITGLPVTCTDAGLPSSAGHFFRKCERRAVDNSCNV